MASLLSKKAKLQEELNNIEKQVYDMETSYLQDPSQCGNVLKGFEGFLSSSKNTALLKRSRKFQPEDRLFSLSSVTSPAVCVPKFKFSTMLTLSVLSLLSLLSVLLLLLCVTNDQDFVHLNRVNCVFHLLYLLHFQMKRKGC
ncbi:Histone acetyltransferase subunit NuA4-domain-containing protein [Citrus sinensis]|uniref:Histone acetyltransferase subunit NuA4-domain-containing protein n=1 Tax=Citrus sinensis TaxID=2711 RepID=A0ACB8MJ41_CITSI|nr:Histone acetyltransferase subunit NuA4-domain-containing protein [Citrus sinensis]